MDFRQLTSPSSTLRRFDIQSKIGAGTYGVVYEAIDREKGTKVAIKKIKLTEDDDGVPSTAIRQICLLKSLNHPNIVKLQEVIYQDEKISLIFEFIDFDLKKYLQHLHRPLKSVEVKKITYQLLMSLYFCHSHRCMHRDLKPQNLLVTRNGILKLADFGLARTFSLPIKAYTHQVVTLWYRAPEILLGAKQYTTAIDIWSVGCIFSELANRKALFIGDSEIDQIFKIFQTLGTPNENHWPEALEYPDFKTTFPKWGPKDVAKIAGDKLSPDGIDLLRKMVALDPKQRISAYDAMNHPYFDDFDKQQLHMAVFGNATGFVGPSGTNKYSVYNKGRKVANNQGSSSEQQLICSNAVLSSSNNNNI